MPLRSLRRVNHVKKWLSAWTVGYIRARHQRPERNFEVVVGKVFDRDGNATRCAFVRNGGSEAVSAASLAFRPRGVNENTSR